ncbi:MAG: hypothetical protein MUF06_16985 [Pirellulaceae bacterium]|jgi:hypothetical protein|nr:hypothetical protein [Pirellulaceae bacterium]
MWGLLRVSKEGGEVVHLGRQAVEVFSKNRSHFLDQRAALACRAAPGALAAAGAADNYQPVASEHETGLFVAVMS